MYLFGNFINRMPCLNIGCYSSGSAHFVFCDRVPYSTGTPETGSLNSKGAPERHLFSHPHYLISCEDHHDKHSIYLAYLYVGSRGLKLDPYDCSPILPSPLALFICRF